MSNSNRAVCIDNRISALPKKIRNFAFGQNGEVVDLTIGRSYKYYGYRINQQGVFLLICTDLVHNDLPWWMPAEFFSSSSVSIDSKWVKKQWGKIIRDTIHAPDVYFDAINDIEDGTDRGRKVFKDMS